mmetsp:Transcript_7175/g.27454  ORF Transcript_7175/g.27454 Transcript_7175/m.27454 type:complete len:147 (-) Transcript_7175:136-576(-)
MLSRVFGALGAARLSRPLTQLASTVKWDLRSLSPTFSRTLASIKHKKVRKMAKGYRGKRRTCYRIAIQAVEKAMKYQYKARRQKKRDMRQLWILRISSALRQYGMNYSRFIPALKSKSIDLDRKILAELAVTEPYSFRSVLEVTKR